jgi:pimeloyl-ACP methyl ester carboxylesterase
VTERIVDVDGVELCLEPFGDPADPTVLLVAGAASSMDWWEPAFCGRLAATGRHVVRYDHRDTGRSSSSPPGAPTYTSNDLQDDVLRVLDALDVGPAHLVGMSMGGGMAQVLAATRPGRVRTLTLVSTSTAGERADRTGLPGMDPRIRATYETPPADPDWSDPEAVLDRLVEDLRPYAGSLGFDEDRTRRIGRVVVARTRVMASSAANHWVLRGEDVPFRMADIAVPTLVLHGTDDPFFPLAHGEALARELPDARLVPMPGMGHEVPPPALWDLAVEEIARHTA